MKSGAASPPPQVLAPPEAFFQKFRDEDRDDARRFYKKNLDVNGLSVAAATEFICRE